MARVNVLDGLGLDATIRRMQRQLVLTYDGTFERARDIPNPWIGCTTLLLDSMSLEAWNGTAWISLAGGTAGAGIIAVATTAENATFVYTGSADPHRLVTFDRVPLRTGRYYRMQIPIHQATDPGPSATAGYVQFRCDSDPSIYDLATYGDGARYLYVIAPPGSSESTTLTWLFAVEATGDYAVWVDFYLKPSGRTVVDAAERAWIEDLGRPPT